MSETRGGRIAVEPSCGNVFADLGLPGADALLAEADARISADEVPPWARPVGLAPGEAVVFDGRGDRVVARPRDGDCACTPGFVCRQNGNCPRRVVHKRPS